MSEQESAGFVEDVAESQERAAQEDAGQTMAASMRKQALSLSGVEVAGGPDDGQLKAAIAELRASSNNPFVKKLLEQADKYAGDASEAGEKAGLDYNERQAKLLEEATKILDAVMRKEKEISRGENTFQVGGQIKMPEGLTGLGVSDEEAFKEFCRVIYNVLGADVAKIESTYNAMIEEQKNDSNTHQPPIVFDTNLPHTFVAVGSARMGQPEVFQSIYVTEARNKE